MLWSKPFVEIRFITYDEIGCDLQVHKLTYEIHPNSTAKVRMMNIPSTSKQKQSGKRKKQKWGRLFLDKNILELLLSKKVV